MNQADSMIFTTENFLKDNGDKIPADKKPGIEQALQQLKDAHKAGDVAAIDSAINNLNTVMQAASQQMYQGGQQAGPQGARAVSKHRVLTMALRMFRMQTSRKLSNITHS